MPPAEVIENATRSLHAFLPSQWLTDGSSVRPIEWKTQPGYLPLPDYPVQCPGKFTMFFTYVPKLVNLTWMGGVAFGINSANFLNIVGAAPYTRRGVRFLFNVLQHGRARRTSTAFRRRGRCFIFANFRRTLRRRTNRPGGCCCFPGYRRWDTRPTHDTKMTGRCTIIARLREGWVNCKVLLIADEDLVLDKAHNVSQSEWFLTWPTREDILWTNFCIRWKAEKKTVRREKKGGEIVGGSESNDHCWPCVREKGFPTRVRQTASGRARFNNAFSPTVSFPLGQFIVGHLNVNAVVYVNRSS